MMFQNQITRQGGGGAGEVGWAQAAACFRRRHQTMQFLNDPAR
jgi:hypothetical protein